MREIIIPGIYLEKIVHPNGRTEHHTTFNELTGPVAVNLLAHPDDDALDEGADILLTESGISVVYATLTHGGGRKVRGLNQEQVIAARIQEEKNAVAEKKGARVSNYGYTDGELTNEKKEGAESVAGLMDVVKPVLIIAPDILDAHPDHVAASEIARMVSGAIPVYTTDTVTGKDKYGNAIVPSHYFEISQEVKNERDEAYGLNITQVTNLPRREKKDVKRVLNGPQRRGAEIGRKYAGVLTLVDPSLGDPFTEIVGREKIVFRREQRRNIRNR
jgi:LmbE family N-acetylglucosaminyl deacetylase